MQPLAIDRDIIMGRYTISPFHMEPGKIYHMAFPDWRIKPILRTYGRPTHRIGGTLEEIHSLNYFEKRRTVKKVLKNRGDADYFLQHFYFLPDVTPRLVRYFDQTASKVFGLEYCFNQYDVLYLDLVGLDETGKYRLMKYLQNRNLEGKIIIVKEFASLPYKDRYDFEEWSEKHLNHPLPESRPNYPHDTTRTGMLPQYP